MKLKDKVVLCKEAYDAVSIKPEGVGIITVYLKYHTVIVPHDKAVITAGVAKATRDSTIQKELQKSQSKGLPTENFNFRREQSLRQYKDDLVKLKEALEIALSQLLVVVSFSNVLITTAQDELVSLEVAAPDAPEESVEEAVEI